MANTAYGNRCNFWMDTETALGTGASSWKGIRPEEVPDFIFSPGTLVANSNAGARNPFDISAKPQYYNGVKAGAVKFSSRIRRPSSDGGTPLMSYFMQSAGWTAEASSADTTTTGTPTATAIQQTTDVTDEGQAVLIERSSGVHVPVLCANVAADVITPSIALSAAPAASAAVTTMHTYTPANAEKGEVPTNKTLQFRLNTHGYFDDALGDLSYLYEGCALGTMGDIEIPLPGNAVTIPLEFHGLLKADSDSDFANDIAADSFNDSGPFGMITDDVEFAFAVGSASGIGTLVAKMYESMSFNLGVAVEPVPAGGNSSFGGIQGYHMVPTSPTVRFKGYFAGDSELEKKIHQELRGSNTSMYVHLIQPTRDLDTPAFGFWLPMCHLTEPDSFNIEMKGNTIMFEASMTGSVTGFDSEVTWDYVTAAPAFFAISSEAA